MKILLRSIGSTALHGKDNLFRHALAPVEKDWVKPPFEAGVSGQSRVYLDLADPSAFIPGKFYAVEITETEAPKRSAKEAQEIATEVAEQA